MNCIAQVGWVSLAVITLAAIGASAIAGWLAGMCMKMMDAADLRDGWRTISAVFENKEKE